MPQSNALATAPRGLLQSYNEKKEESERVKRKLSNEAYL